MSWGIEITGTRDAVKKAVDAQLTKSSTFYEGKPERDDILMCRDRALALIDAIVFAEGFNAVTVKAMALTTPAERELARQAFSLASRGPF